MSRRPSLAPGDHLGDIGFFILVSFKGLRVLELESNRLYLGGLL